jgi:hypothetical protein
MRGHNLGIALFLFLPGMISLYFGTLYTGRVCDSGGGNCVVRHVGEISFLPVLVGVVFILFGVYALWGYWRRN